VPGALLRPVWCAYGMPGALLRPVWRALVGGVGSSGGLRELGLDSSSRRTSGCLDELGLTAGPLVGGVGSSGGLRELGLDSSSRRTSGCLDELGLTAGPLLEVDELGLTAGPLLEVDELGLTAECPGIISAPNSRRIEGPGRISGTPSNRRSE
jgi:hypothetical protein